MPYQATQLLRFVPEKQSPKIPSFENQWGSHSGDPQTYNKLRNGSLKVHMWTHRPQSPKQRDLDFRYMRLVCYSESINLRGRQLIFLIQHKAKGRRQHLHSLLLPYSSQQAPSFSFSHFYYPHQLVFLFFFSCRSNLYALPLLFQPEGTIFTLSICCAPECQYLPEGV